MGQAQGQVSQRQGASSLLRVLEAQAMLCLWPAQTTWSLPTRKTHPAGPSYALQNLPSVALAKQGQIRRTAASSEA